MAIKPDIEAVIEHNHITAGAVISQASGYAATATSLFSLGTAAMGAGLDYAAYDSEITATAFIISGSAEALQVAAPPPIKPVTGLILEVQQNLFRETMDEYSKQN